MRLSLLRLHLAGNTARHASPTGPSGGAGRVAPDRVYRVGVDGDAARHRPWRRPRPAARRPQMCAATDRSRARSPAVRCRVSQCSGGGSTSELDLPRLAVDLLAGLQGVAAVDEQHGFACSARSRDRADPVKPVSQASRSSEAATYSFCCWSARGTTKPVSLRRASSSRKALRRAVSATPLSGSSKVWKKGFEHRLRTLFRWIASETAGSGWSGSKRPSDHILA